MMASPSVLLAGAPPGEAAGLSVMSAMMLDALRACGGVELLTHQIAALPFAREDRSTPLPSLTLGVQPLTVHGEAAVAGRLHRRRLRNFSLGWAVGSRFAEALRLARVPYLIWEATTLRDEMATVSVSSVRRSGRGTGLGTMLFKALLPYNEHLEGRAYRGAEAVLALSNYTASRIRALHSLDGDRVRVLLPPVAPHFLAALHHARASIDTTNRREGEPATALRLLFVGRVDDPRKNFSLLRDAYLRLRASNPRVSLTVVGPHTEAWRRNQGLDGVEGVRFLGSVSQENLPRELLAHDVLVVPSRQEGFGIVVSEAMHAAVPVVSTRCGGPEQVLRESGAGILVDHAPDALADGIRTLGLDPALRATMGARGRAYAERELSTERFRQRVAAELERLRVHCHGDPRA